MKLITERNLLYAYTPLDIHNPHKKNFPLPFSDQGTEVHGQYWGAEEYMIYDMLADVLRLNVYNKKKPKPSILKRTISRLDRDTIETEFTRNRVEENQVLPPISFSFMTLQRHYVFLNQYNPKRFHHFLEQAAGIKIKCNYRFKIYHIGYDNDREDNRTSKKGDFYKFPFRPKNPQSLFDFEFDEKTKRYKIYFRSGLGALFANNVIAAEWEWLPFEFFKLSKNAQNLYRKYILVKKKGSVFRLSYLDIAQTLKFSTPNQTAKRKAVERLLDELADDENRYIEYKLEKGYQDFVYSIKKLKSN